MTILKAHFATGSAFLDCYLADLGNGGIFFPTRKPLALGEAVVISIRLGKRRSPMLLRGLVAWRRPGKHSTKTKAGIGIEFLPTEAQTRDYLLSVARGDASEQLARRHQRLPVELPVTWQVPGALRDNSGTLLDIGRGGAFVRTAQPLPDDADVVLMVSPPGAEIAMPLSARVCWRGANQTGGENGFGVEWKARDAGGNRRIKELVRRIEAMGESVYGRAMAAGAQPRSSA
ncbi:MAG TPA: PilZ domain-containing protein [Polyangia bacterium]|nr:PilZ domain-containing protein [Polyangia bacterium]